MTAVLNEAATTVTPVTLSPASLRNALSACLLTAARASNALPVLEAVHVAKTGDQLVFRSTDRYQLVVVTVTLQGAPDGDWTTLIPAVDAKRAVTALPKTARDLVIATIAPDTIDLPGVSTLRFLPQDGDFPRTAQIIPTVTEPVEEIDLSTKSLADLARMPGRSANEPVRLVFAGPQKPVRCEWGNDDVRYLYLLMPTKIAD